MPVKDPERRKAIARAYAQSEKGRKAQLDFRERNRAANAARQLVGRKRCPSCRKTKQVVRWHRNRNTKDGLATYCIVCSNQKAVEQRWMRKYGITKEQYEELLAKQRGGCAICGRPCPTGQRLAVDHDHTTGAIRGLLCRTHNRGLGLLGDSVKAIEKVLTYLKGEQR